MTNIHHRMHICRDINKTRSVFILLCRVRRDFIPQWICSYYKLIENYKSIENYKIDQL